MMTRFSRRNTPLELTKLCCLSLLQSAGSEEAVLAQLQGNPAAVEAWKIFHENVKNCTIDAGPELEDDKSDEHLSKKVKAEVEGQTTGILSHKMNGHLSENFKKELKDLPYYFLYSEFETKPEERIKKMIQLIISDAVGLLSGRKLDGGEDQRILIEEIEFLKMESETFGSSQHYSTEHPQHRYFISNRDRRISAIYDENPRSEDSPVCSLEDVHSRETLPPRRCRKGWNRSNSKTRLDMSPLPLQTMFVIQRVLQTMTNLGIGVEQPQWQFVHTTGEKYC